MIVTEIMWIREIITKADIVIWSIQDLMDGIEPTQDKKERACFDNILKNRLSEIVKHHQSMHRYFCIIFFSFTLYPAFSRIGRGSLVLRHSAVL